jgi:alkylhydroperoxidase family enzyme
MRRSWVPTADGAVGGTLLEQVAAHRPDYAAALAEVRDALQEQDLVDAQTLELCRLRIGTLLGAAVVPEGVAPELAEALPRYYDDPRFAGPPRIALGYAEQVLLDAAEVDDAQVQEVVGAFGEGGFLVLTYACGLFETTQRAELLLGQEEEAL